MSEAHSGFLLLGNIDGSSNTKKCENMVDPTNAQDYMTMNYYDTTFSEKVDDRVNSLIVDGEAFNSVYDDVANTLTCSCELATDTNKGVASFDLTDFSVTSGAVALKAAVCMSVDGDTGTATPSIHNIDILGGDGITTLGASNDITITNSDHSAVTTNSAKVTESTTVTSPLVLTTYDISLPVATTSADGYLSQTDWDTFNNKQSAFPVADTQTLIKGSVDATKLVRFEADGLTTATTRVLTVPDKDITIADNADIPSVSDTAYDATTWNANSDAGTKNAIRDKVETMNTAIGLNTAKNTNVTTNITVVEAPTNVDIQSSDGSNDTIAAADVTNAGVMTTTMYDNHILNNAKETDVNHNVTTNLSAGTRAPTTINVNSSDGTNATLVEADTTNAGILGSDKWDEIVANSLKNTYPSADSTKVGHLSVTQAVNLDTMESNIATNNSKVTNATHTGEVTGSEALTIANNIVDEANLKLDVVPTNDYVLTADSTASGGMKWAEASGGFSDPMTTVGDIIFKNASNVTTRLGVGSVNQVLQSDGTNLAYQTLIASDISDFDTEVSNNSSVTSNTAKVTNATHTGDVTGATALTIGANKVLDSHVNWGTGATQVSAVDLVIADAGAKITATEVEGALQENRTAINLNTTHSSSDGSDHSKVGANETAIALNTTHRGSAGTDHSDVGLANTHRGLTNEHLDWTADLGAVNINSANYTDTNTTDHTAFSNIGTNTHAQIDTAITSSTNHIADNSQAHSDYLTNNAADTMAGALTINPGTLFIQEQAAASADVAGLGQLWTKTATPNELWFTDDAGGAHQLASATAGTVSSIIAGEGIDVDTPTGNVTVSGEDATTTNKGIASFNTDDFTVSSGVVSVKSAATKEMFFPATGSTDDSPVSHHEKYAVRKHYNAMHDNFVTFMIPYDFSSITSAEIIVIPGSTNASSDVDIYSNYGSIGESCTIHAQENTASTYNFTNNQIAAIDISGILSSLAAGDFVGIKTIKNDDGHLYILGVKFKYS